MNGRAVTAAERIPAAAGCARLVCHLLGKGDQRHRGARQPDDNFWTKTAYTIPDTPHADVKPGQTGVKMVPINRMVPRSFITNIKSGATIHGKCLNVGPRHRVRRRYRRGRCRFICRRRQELAGDHGWQRRGQVQLSAMAGSGHLAGRRKLHAVGALHQQQRRRATRSGELESHRASCATSSKQRRSSWPEEIARVAHHIHPRAVECRRRNAAHRLCPIATNAQVGFG